MPARDLEADVALDLIKEYDPNGERTMGVLTKVDLMMKILIYLIILKIMYQKI